MKKLVFLIITLVFYSQTIKAQTVVLDANGVTVKWTGTTVPSPYFVQANPRGTGMEWYAIVDNSTKHIINWYARNFQQGINYFTPPDGSSPIPFNNIITTLVTNMHNLFLYYSAPNFFEGTYFNQNIDSWDVSNVTDMSFMFFNCYAFNQPIGYWNVGNVTNMLGMFYTAWAFNQPIGSWNVSNVNTMQQMFSSATAFNQPIGSWNVSNVTNMQNMFANAFGFNQPIGSWNVGSVTDMSYMFAMSSSNASNFNQPIGSWNVSNVTDMSDMFYGVQLSTANYDDLLIGWSTISPNETPLKPNVVFSGGNSEYCNGATSRASLISNYGWTITDAGLNCSQPVILDANGVTIKYNGTTAPSTYFVQANPRGTGMEWFAIVDNSTKNNISDYARNIQSGIAYFTRPSTTTPIPFNNIVTTLVTDMGFMFSQATGFNQPISCWDVSNVTNMHSMFGNATSFNQNIGSWNVINVTDMSYMFMATASFNQPIGSWNVSNVNNMVNMFMSAFSFNQPIGSWNVSNVTNMDDMFGAATSFNQPIGAWNVGNVTNMFSMFYNATSFNQPIGSWNVSNVTDMRFMFYFDQLSTDNYDDLLIGWSTISPNETPLKPNVVFSGGNSYYCNGYAARTSILNTYNWTITDLGLAINCSDLATEAFDKSSVSLYPNPVVSILNINANYNLINQPYTIIDGLGRMVLNGKLNEIETTINVEQLSKGIYYLKVSDKNANKFIKE